MSVDIELDVDFDSASLDLARTRIERDRIRLYGLENHNEGFWKWIYFRARGVEGRSLVFEIANNFETGSHRLDHHKMVYSYDREAWRFFPLNRHDAVSGRFEFELGAPFEREKVYIAYGIPYPYERLVQFVDLIRPSPFVLPTPSSDARLVIGRTPGGVDEIGRVVPPQNLFGFRITDPTVSGRKERIVVMGGVHPNEPLGNHAIEGLVEFLIDSEDREADLLRRRAETFIYPMVNPDGRRAGYNRSTLQHVGRDANRFWREDLYADMDDIRQVAEAIKEDAGRGIAFFVDFHCWTHTVAHFGILARSEGFHRDPFWLALRELEPSLREDDSVWENWSAETFAFKILEARFAMTLETMFIPDENIDRFKRLGRNVGRAFWRAFAPEAVSPSR